jgi:hypothetical protein
MPIHEIIALLIGMLPAGVGVTLREWFASRRAVTTTLLDRTQLDATMREYTDRLERQNDRLERALYAMERKAEAWERACRHLDRLAHAMRHNWNNERYAARNPEMVPPIPFLEDLMPEEDPAAPVDPIGKPSSSSKTPADER